MIIRKDFMKVVYCCTKSWYHYLCVAIYSLLKYNDVDTLYLFIEDDDFEELNNIRNLFDIKIIIFNYNKILDNYLDKNNANRNTFYSPAALVRLFLSDFIKEEKVLYLDTDTIVLGDLTGLYNEDIKPYYIAGVLDKGILNMLDYLDSKNISEDDYINSGVMLMNLKKIAIDRIIPKFIKYLNKEKYKFPDQDIINIVCHKKIKLVDYKYNSAPLIGFHEDMKILHFAYKKNNWVEGFPYSEKWYNMEHEYLSDIEKE